jgi:long-chain acyl-CoA synthetase
MNPRINPKKVGTVGMPISNTLIRLVNTENQDVPQGEPGEVIVKGPQVMNGYLNKPEENKKVFDKDGWLHTGDVAIMDEEGYFRIVDRIKDMIIVSGYKVFSTKVEDILSKHPAIDMIALIGIPNPERPGSELVKAYVTIKPTYEGSRDPSALKAEILAFAKEHLAPYEVPKLVEIRNELPLSTVGKVLKKDLRAEMKKS